MRQVNTFCTQRVNFFRVFREPLGACMQRHSNSADAFFSSRSVISAPPLFIYVARKFRLSRGFQFAPSARAAGCFCNFTSCNATAQLCHFICRHFEVEVAPECVTAPRSMQIAFLLDAAPLSNEKTKSNAHSCQQNTKLAALIYLDLGDRNFLTWPGAI